MDDISKENRGVLIPEYVSDNDVRVWAAHDLSIHHNTRDGIEFL